MSQQRESWTKWALAEGVGKSISASALKHAGANVGHPIVGGLAGAVLIEVIRFFLSGAALVARKESWRITRREAVLGVFYATVSLSADTAKLVGFTDPSAQVGAATFLVLTSIVPGAILDWLFFGDRLNIRQLVGISLFLFAGWCFLDRPSLDYFASPPLWVKINLALAVALAINEATMRSIGAKESSSPFATSFWLSIYGLTGLAIIVPLASTIADVPVASVLNRNAVAAFFVSGLAVFSYTIFRRLAYRDNARLVYKKLIMLATYLFGASLIGSMLYGEPFTVSKVLGGLLFVPAYVLTSNRFSAELRAAWFQRQASAS
ncbi:MAG: hypothetical protein IT290_07690 [Deltaproteobacteria bacterium]|nr:hypothetical protein [Deltaproteobacteria bacterium]